MRVFAVVVFGCELEDGGCAGWTGNRFGLRRSYVRTFQVSLLRRRERGSEKNEQEHAEKLSQNSAPLTDDLHRRGILRLRGRAAKIGRGNDAATPLRMTALHF